MNKELYCFFLFFLLVSIIGCSDTSLSNQNIRTTGEGEISVTKPYLLALHVCKTATTCDTPGTHEVYLAQSDDGMSWELVPSWVPFQGSVPDVIRREDTLYFFTAINEGTLVRYHMDRSQWDEATSVKVEGLGADGFVDPSLILNEEGRLVLFFLYGKEKGVNPAGCLPEEESCTQHFGSATEVEGSDGTQFSLDNGDRVQVELSEGGESSASDPDIFFDGKQYILYIAHAESLSVWTSSDLRGEYSQVNQRLSNQSGGVGSGYYDQASGTYWSYVHNTDPDTGSSTIRWASHTTFLELLGEGEWNTVISASTLGLDDDYSVASPSFAVN